MKKSPLLDRKTRKSQAEHTPGSAEGDLETVEESLKEKEEAGV